MRKWCGGGMCEIGGMKWKYYIVNKGYIYKHTLIHIIYFYILALKNDQSRVVYIII